jgi:peptidoglycan-associated lipoprotein
MNKSLIGTILLAVMLTACSSKPMKDAATVDDKSVSSSSSSSSTDSSASTSGATSSSMGVNPLTCLSAASTSILTRMK